MLFLGAGASRAFGVKTLQEMSEDLLKVMEKKGYSDSVNIIINNLRKYGLETDFEAIYTIIQAMSNFKQSMKTAGPLAAYICRESIPLIEPEKCQELLKEFKAFLLNACRPNSSEMNKISHTYSELFSILSASNFNEREQWQRGNFEATTIVTTNYDMILEQYFWHNSKPFADGFVRTTEQPQVGQLDLWTQNIALYQ